MAAQVYDWCYPLLTEADKKLIRDRFYWLAVEMETSWPPFLEPASYGHGNEAQVSRDLLAISIAMYDEDPLPYQYVSWKMLKELQPVKRHLYLSGMHDQGTAYGAVRFRWDLFGALQFRRSMNYELLGVGNAVHMHWHFFPRRQGDTPEKGPIWKVDREEMYADKYRPNAEELETLKTALLTELDPLIG